FSRRRLHPGRGRGGSAGPGAGPGRGPGAGTAMDPGEPGAGTGGGPGPAHSGTHWRQRLVNPVPAPLRGLYAITSAALCADPARLRAAVAAALRGGASLVQLRDKHSTPEARRANARALAVLCHEHGARLIVND